MINPEEKKITQLADNLGIQGMLHDALKKYYDLIDTVSPMIITLHDITGKDEYKETIQSMISQLDDQIDTLYNMCKDFGVSTELDSTSPVPTVVEGYGKKKKRCKGCGAQMLGGDPVENMKFFNKMQYNSQDAADVAADAVVSSTGIGGPDGTVGDGAVGDAAF